MRIGKYKLNWMYTGCNQPINNAKLSKYTAPVQEEPVKCETTCYINEVTGDPENPYKEVVSVTIRKYHKDVFNKITARKVSFTRAISTFPKELRKQFWDKFLAEIKH